MDSTAVALADMLVGLLEYRDPFFRGGTSLTRLLTSAIGRELGIDAEAVKAIALGAVATTNIWFGVGAPASRFVIPKLCEPWRADELWRTTCFEAFLRPVGAEPYREWNFAPSGNWAAYDFSRHREDMARAEVGAPPYIRMEDNFTWWTVGATIAVDAAHSAITRA